MNLVFLPLMVEVDKVSRCHISAVSDKPELVGVVDLMPSPEESATIYALFVNEEARRQGVGSRLIYECERVASLWKCQSIGLVVVKENQKVLEFYRKLGFSFFCHHDGNWFCHKRISTSPLV